MNVVQTVFGVFHHFELARQMEQRGWLRTVYSTWPWTRLRREGIAQERVATFPWIHGPEMLMRRFGIGSSSLYNEMGYANALAFDLWTDRQLRLRPTPDVLIGISGSSLRTGRAVQQRGARFVCDRGSSHQRYQERLVSEELVRWGVRSSAADPRDTKREEAIYAVADAITVPSQFAARSFLAEGVPASKVHVIPYGVQLENFSRVADPEPTRFDVLFAGAVGLRKGVPYLLEAFSRVRCAGKRLTLAGTVEPEIRSILRQLPQENVEFLGPVTQGRLRHLMSSSHLMVLPSIEEGLALVQGQALACGCPVLATTNTGAEDLFTDGVEGFIVPVRRPDLLVHRMQQLCDYPDLQQRMSKAALRRVAELGGWDRYGAQWETLLRSLTGQFAEATPPPTK